MWHADANTITSMVKPVAETPNKTMSTKSSHHNFQISNVDHLEKNFSNVRQKWSRRLTMTSTFMSATMLAAAHLAHDYQENLRTNKNTDYEKVKTL